MKSLRKGQFCESGCSPLKVSAGLCSTYRPDGSPRQPAPQGDARLASAEIEGLYAVTPLSLRCEMWFAEHAPAQAIRRLDGTVVVGSSAMEVLLDAMRAAGLVVRAEAGGLVFTLPAAGWRAMIGSTEKHANDEGGHEIRTLEDFVDVLGGAIEAGKLPNVAGLDDEGTTAGGVRLLALVLDGGGDDAPRIAVRVGPWVGPPEDMDLVPDPRSSRIGEGSAA
jgi:hypothetical protein